MTEATEVTAETRISARGWTKLILMFALAIGALVFIYGHWPLDRWIENAAVNEYNQTYAEESNPLVGNGEGQIGAFFVLLFCHGGIVFAAFLVASIIVQNGINFVWRKPKDTAPA